MKILAAIGYMIFAIISVVIGNLVWGIVSAWYVNREAPELFKQFKK